MKLADDQPRSGIPPAFRSWQALAEFVEWGSKGDRFRDSTYLWWDLRPRPDFGTLEFRVADTQTSVEHTAAIAAIWQSLVAALRARFRAGEPFAGAPDPRDQREPLARAPRRARLHPRRSRHGRGRARTHADRAAAARARAVCRRARLQRRAGAGVATAQCERRRRPAESRRDARALAVCCGTS